MNAPSDNINKYDEDNLDIGKIFRLLMMQSKLIALIIILFTSASVIFYLYAERTYKITSLLQVTPNDSRNFTQGDFTVGSTYTQDTDSIQQLYKSRSNMLTVIDDLDLNVEIEGFSHSETEFIKSFEVVNFIDNEEEFILKLFNNNYEIFSKEEISYGKQTYGAKLENNKVSIEVSEPKPSLKNTSLIVKVIKPEIYYPVVLKSFEVLPRVSSPYSAWMNMGAILEINYISNDIEQAIEILDYANNFFIEQSIEIESEQARRALDFIDLRAFDIEQELELKKNRLKNFRTINKTVDVDLEIQTIISSLNELDTKINEIDIEIEKARSDFTETNPIFINLLGQKQTILGQRNEIEDKIETLPLSQQQYIDLFRDLEITQEVFNALQNRKLEFSIREASTLGNMRIIDSAYYFSRVSPRIISVFLACFLSIIASFILAIIRGIYFIPLSNPAELEDSKIHVPIVGVINKLDEADTTEESERFRQSVESLIVNIQTRIPDEDNKCKTVVLTSATPLNGKSFVSRNIAQKLAGLGNKVLLIDADYKRGDQHTAFNLKKISLSKFFDMNDSSIEEFKVNETDLYVMPRISRIGSSFEFLYDARFQVQIDKFKDIFDYIIIDTAPLLSVSDTMILLSLGDLRLCVVRHGLSKINEIKQTLALFNQIGLEPDGMIYNCYEKPSSYYGYYGMYGNYSYQYYAKRYLYQSYDYNEKT